MKKSDYVVAAVLGLLIVMAVKYFLPQVPEQAVPDLPPGSDAQPIIEELQKPAIRYPVPERPPNIEQQVAEPEPPQQGSTAEVAEPAPVKPLPALDDSDDALKQDLYELAAGQVLDSLFNLNRIIRRFVVTVDNLPRKHLLNSKYRSNQAIRGQLLVRRDSHGLYLSEENYARYEAFIDLLDSMNSDQIVALYLYYYPLLQKAYEDLGYPSAYFNDRLIEVIDHLLEAPDTGGRISLVRPHVLYQYADPELEALSAGQKVLIRIGSRNAARVKTRLRELRRALAGE